MTIGEVKHKHFTNLLTNFLTVNFVHIRHFLSVKKYFVLICMKVHVLHIYTHTGTHRAGHSQFGALGKILGGASCAVY